MRLTFLSDNIKQYHIVTLLFLRSTSYTLILTIIRNVKISLILFNSLITVLTYSNAMEYVDLMVTTKHIYAVILYACIKCQLKNEKTRIAQETRKIVMYMRNLPMTILRSHFITTLVEWPTMCTQPNVYLSVHRCRRRAKFPSYFNPNVLERYCYFYCVFIR